MWNRLRRFSALEPRAQKAFLQAIVLLPLITLSLRSRGFRATQISLQRLLSLAGNGPPGSHSDKNVAITAHMVNAADRHSFIHPSCLAKSLALWWLLERQGISSSLRIGIRKEKGKFEAHAWVECDGIVLNEPEEHHRHYAAFSSLPRDES
jgi:hypothetical protein